LAAEPAASAVNEARAKGSRPDMIKSVAKHATDFLFERLNQQPLPLMRQEQKAVAPILETCSCRICGFV